MKLQLTVCRRNYNSNSSENDYPNTLRQRFFDEVYANAD